jgi:hypothetical protein
MKKVGIITMHKLHNYGSILQSYALQKVIREMGYECELIDYIYPNEFQFKRNYSNNAKSVKSSLSKFLHLFKIFRLSSWWKAEKGMMNFRKKYCNLSKNTYHNPDEIHADVPVYDIYVTGSDQVWNLQYTKGDTTFFLSFVSSVKKIAYSASSGGERLGKEYKDLLDQYSHISVRETSGALMLKKLLNKQVQVTLDPTLLLNLNNWKEISSVRKNRYYGEKYILLYILDYSFNPYPYTHHLLRHIKKNTNLKIFSLTKIPKPFKKNITIIDDADPITFLHLFESASIIVTSSFHGSAFAVNFGIPLYSIIDDQSTDNRQSDFLKDIGINHCLVPKDTEFSLLNPYYDKKTVTEKLNTQRKESLNYLERALKDN